MDNSDYVKTLKDKIEDLEEYNSGLICQNDELRKMIKDQDELIKKLWEDGLWDRRR